MLKNIYDHFLVLYEKILPSNPTLASEHALKQEQEVYDQSTKATYRNAAIFSIAALKKRPQPDSPSHPSVGTEADLAARAKTQSLTSSLRLTRTHLEPYILSLETLQSWGYFVAVPPGAGGEEPSMEGKVATCERCAQKYQVKRDPDMEECSYHPQRAYFRNVSGERVRIHGCCGKPASEAGGCITAPHVFYESNPEDLHKRHPFSFLRPPKEDETALDVVALDCEMVYTTGGSRVARVSVVDGSGKEIFDELVRMDDGVEVVDYITRWSGITPELHAKALLTLSSIRRLLDTHLNTETIIVGHALENDLKTLRIVHHRCVDTVVMFPHPAGSPYRKALRDLVKEHLNQNIQTGGSLVGHSSVEDSIATLNLVKWHVVNSKDKGKPAS